MHYNNNNNKSGTNYNNRLNSNAMGESDYVNILYL